MNAETLAHIIQVSLAPVVMVTSCALLIGGVLQEYSAVNDRMRAMVRERLELVRAADAADLAAALAHAGPFAHERLAELDTQLPELLRRHRLLRDAVLTLYVAILVFVVTMCAIAAAIIWQASPVSGVLNVFTLLLFLGGTGVLLWGILQVARTIRSSHHAVQFEVERVLSLGR